MVIAIILISAVHSSLAFAPFQTRGIVRSSIKIQLVNYEHAIPDSQLGISHDTLSSYTDAVNTSNRHNKNAKSDDVVPKAFSFVVVLSENDHNRDCSSNISILLGKKLRGFGKGFYSCFGGKLEKSQDEHTHPARGAVRELREETGISVPLSLMEDGFVGTINFTFEDNDVNCAMKVHLYCVFISTEQDDTKYEMQQCKHQSAQLQVLNVDPEQIRGCDEIEPKWFHDIQNIPLDQMFADDSLWLKMLLSHYNTNAKSQLPEKLMFDAWFHFHPGGAKTNSIMHNFIEINEANGTTGTISATTVKPLSQTMTLGGGGRPSKRHPTSLSAKGNDFEDIPSDESLDKEDDQALTAPSPQSIVQGRMENGNYLDILALAVVCFFIATAWLSGGRLFNDYTHSYNSLNNGKSSVYKYVDADEILREDFDRESSSIMF